MYFQADLKELFPLKEAVKRHIEVVQFCAGLMSDPTPLVGYVYELWIDENLDKVRYHDDGSLVDEKLFKSLYSEAKQLPGDALNNPWINWSEYSDETPIFIPSRFYGFKEMREEVVCYTEHGREERKIPECEVFVHMDLYRQPAPVVAASILHACQTICQRQKITDLWICDFKCDDMTLTCVFSLSPKVQSLHLVRCDLPPDVTTHLLKELAHCRQLTKLDLSQTTLGAAGCHLAASITSWGLNPPLKELWLDDCEIPQDASVEVVKSLSACKHLTQGRTQDFPLEGAPTSDTGAFR